MEAIPLGNYRALRKKGGGQRAAPDNRIRNSQKAEAVNFFKEKILPGLLTAVLLAILGALVKIYSVVETLPDKLDDNQRQHERYDELLQQEMDKVHELEKQVLILQTLNSK